MTAASRDRLQLVLLFLGGFAFLLGLEALARSRAGTDSLHWGSEDLLQTVPIADLAQEPVRSLVYLHVQPPALDMIRAALAGLTPGTDLFERAGRVDRRLLILWAAAYAALGCLVDAWLRDLVPPAAALGASIALLLHPAAILYATVPDTTLLSATLLCWCLRELWLLGCRQGSAVRLGCSVVALFLVRSIFQWPAVVVFAVSLVLLGVARRRIAVFLLVVAPLVGGYVVKQQVLFGLWTTTSFSGFSCMRSIGLLPFGFDRGQGFSLPPDERRAGREWDLAALPARVLRTETKLTGMPNCNHWRYLVYNDLLLGACRREYGALPWGKRLAGYGSNLRLYLEPSSRYANVQPILDNVPWRGAYDWLLSGARLGFLVGGAGLWWALRRMSGPEPRAPARERAVSAAGYAMGLALPVAMVMAASILLERGENMRFKFLVEPVLWVFVIAQAVSLAQAARARLHA